MHLYRRENYILVDKIAVMTNQNSPRSTKGRKPKRIANGCVEMVKSDAVRYATKLMVMKPLKRYIRGMLGTLFDSGTFWGTFWGT